MDLFHQSNGPPVILELWACKICCWIWETSRPYCGICGRAKAQCTACPGHVLKMALPGTVPGHFSTSGQSANLGHLS